MTGKCAGRAPGAAAEASHRPSTRAQGPAAQVRLQAVHGGYAGGNKGIQRVSVVGSERWTARLVADDQKVRLIQFNCYMKNP